VATAQQHARADVRTPHRSATTPITANAVAVTPRANPTAEPSGPNRMAQRPGGQQEQREPTSIASAPQSVQRMARRLTCRST
jgi:hypothetical protein